MNDNILRLQIGTTDVFIEEIEMNKGKITISDHDKNYSYYWGSMGGTLQEFLCRINADYFASKLLGARNALDMNVKSTFRDIRKYIVDDLDLHWFMHMEFQKDMRKRLNEFQNRCAEINNPEYFVNNFHSFVDDLDYSLIECRFDRKEVEENFKSISECWHFIVEKESNEYIWLKVLHVSIKNRLSKKKAA